MTDYAFLSRGPGARATLVWRCATLPDALQDAQIDEKVDQGVEVGNRLAVADVRTFDAQGHCLAPHLIPSQAPQAAIA